MTWVNVAVGVASIAVGAYSANKANKANEAGQQASIDDYNKRVAEAQKGFAIMEQNYNNAKAERPDLTWEAYSAGLVKALNDPALTKAYADSKADDFKHLEVLAKRATTDNSETFKQTFDFISNGKGKEITDQRNELVLNDDVEARVKRAYELRAPQIGAGTVRYDSKGNLIEGQRADKQVFTTAYEETVAANRERLANLSALERERSSTAASQQQRASDFMSFYDATGLKATAFDKNRTENIDFAKLDQMQAFQLMNTFAQASLGITATQPQYQDPSKGYAMAAQGLTAAAAGYASYANNKQANANSSTGGSTSMSSGVYGSSGTKGGPTYM